MNCGAHKKVVIGLLFRSIYAIITDYARIPITYNCLKLISIITTIFRTSMTGCATLAEKVIHDLW